MEENFSLRPHHKFDKQLPWSVEISFSEEQLQFLTAEHVNAWQMLCIPKHYYVWGKS